MKILHLSISLGSGGKERQIVELLKGLSAYDHIHCDLAVMTDNIHYDAVNELRCNIHKLIRQNKKDPMLFLKLYNLCRRIQPDIIHTWDSITSIYALPSAKLLGIPLINGMIRWAPLKLKLFSKASIRSKITFLFSNVIVANSYAGLRSFGSPSHKSVCIYNGFDINRIKNLKNSDLIKKKYGITTDNIVGMVGEFADRKDYFTFLAAAQMILQERDDTTFLTIGTGENIENCKQLVSLQFRNKIKFLGLQKDVESIENIFNIGVLVSNPVYGEGISNAIMEYMALGKPVVATDSGGTNELVLDGQTGFIVKPYDEKDIYHRINILLDDKALCHKMGKAAKERIYHAFSLEKMTEGYIKLYEETIS